MPAGIDISVIICTHNRADSLAETLKAFEKIRVPPNRAVELIIVDNNSADATKDVVNSSQFPFPVCYHFEPKPGLSNARNSGLAITRGEAILFTDDDVLPPNNWLTLMAAPLLEKRCAAVVGDVTLPAHLRRPWLRRMHNIWMAVPIDEPNRRLELVGANMGFHRSVLSRVPFFDPELGAGALGFMEETLFSYQLESAGFRLAPVAMDSMLHFMEASRLRRGEWLNSARKRGASLAYLLHHWQHGTIKNLIFRIAYLKTKLNFRRKLRPPVDFEDEGCSEWEMSYVAELYRCLGFLSERKRPRNYEKHGLRKLAGQLPLRPAPNLYAQTI